MDSSRRSYLIAAVVMIAAMVIAALVVGVPGCGPERPEVSDVQPQAPREPGAVPQDRNPGDTGSIEEEYGDSGPQSAGPLRMRAVPNTGATVIYDLAAIRQILYRTKTAGVSGIANLAPANVSPSVASTVRSLTARNPASTGQKTVRSSVSIAGVKGVRVVNEVGPPADTYTVTVVAKVKDQVLTVSATGPKGKRQAVSSLADQLAKAAVVKSISESEAKEAAEEVAPARNPAGSDSGTEGTGGSEGPGSEGSASEGSASGGSASGGSASEGPGSTKGSGGSEGAGKSAGSSRPSDKSSVQGESTSPGASSDSRIQASPLR